MLGLEPLAQQSNTSLASRAADRRANHCVYRLMERESSLGEFANLKSQEALSRFHRLRGFGRWPTGAMKESDLNYPLNRYPLSY
jgi:hypothetical protein